MYISFNQSVTVINRQQVKSVCVCGVELLLSNLERLLEVFMYRFKYTCYTRSYIFKLF